MSGLKMVCAKERDALCQHVERDAPGCLVGRQHARQTAQSKIEKQNL
jgi:hypothetical protein